MSNEEYNKFYFGTFSQEMFEVTENNTEEEKKSIIEK